MDKFKFTIALLCVVAAFVLYWRHIEGAGNFLTLIGGSPIAEAALRKLNDTASKDAGSAPSANQ